MDGTNQSHDQRLSNYIKSNRRTNPSARHSREMKVQIGGQYINMEPEIGQSGG